MGLWGLGRETRFAAGPEPCGREEDRRGARQPEHCAEQAGGVVAREEQRQPIDGTEGAEKEGELEPAACQRPSPNGLKQTNGDHRGGEATDELLGAGVGTAEDEAGQWATEACDAECADGQGRGIQEQETDLIAQCATVPVGGSGLEKDHQEGAGEVDERAAELAGAGVAAEIIPGDMPLGDEQVALQEGVLAQDESGAGKGVGSQLPAAWADWLTVGWCDLSAPDQEGRECQEREGAREDGRLGGDPDARAGKARRQANQRAAEADDGEAPEPRHSGADGIAELGPEIGEDNRKGDGHQRIPRKMKE